MALLLVQDPLDPRVEELLRAFESAPIDEPSRVEEVARVAGDRQRPLDMRMRAAVVLDRAGDPRAFAAGTEMARSLDDEAVPAIVRLAVAERLQRRGELAPLGQALSALGRIRAVDPALAARVDALEARLKYREEPAERVVPLPSPKPRGSRSSSSKDRSKRRRRNVIILGGAGALAVILLATRRRA